MNIKKTKKANLERQRILFFEIGLILSLALVFMAFEWKWPEKRSMVLNLNRKLIEVEDMTGIYEKKEMPVPPQLKIIMPIVVPDDTDTPMDDDPFNPEDDPNVFNELDAQVWTIKEIETEDTVVHVFVQRMPEFPGGESALMAYLGKNVKFPTSAREVGISGTVIVSFIVWNDGSIRHIEVLRDIGGGLEEGVVQAVMQMPRWVPGMQNGKKVNVKFVLPVKFQLRG